MSDDKEVTLPEGEEESLAAELSPDVAPVVQEFMAEAAQANEEEAEAIAQESTSAADAGPAGAASSAAAPINPYISFEHVCKSFGAFFLLWDVGFFFNPGETLCILGRSGFGK